MSQHLIPLLSMLRLGVYVILFFTCSVGLYAQPNNEIFDKVNGMSFVAVDHEVDAVHVTPMKDIGANWVAIIPFAYMPAATMPELMYDAKWQWLGERIEGARGHIRGMHAQNIAVMMKPQIWIGHGTYTGKISMKSDEDWGALEANYSSYILDYAKMAEEEGVEMFCIGTELKLFVAQRNEYWLKLISSVREVFTGKLTYAANWDEYSGVSFWDKLDFIGVDAYFPISKEGKTKIKELKKGWKRHLNLMDTIAEKFEMKILFTEYGYRSIKNCSAKPWDYSEDAKVDQKSQCVALEALYQVMWKNDNFAGGFLWKWHADHGDAGGKENSMFTVQNKEAAAVVEKYYR
ncbi:MAG: hypothetical protein ACI865_000726 [Flavobacteriaceae bacterium]|jgi:hypothetical protein